MLAGLITLTPGGQNKFIDCQKAKVWIAVLPIMDVKILSNSTLEFPKHIYRFHEFTPKLLTNTKYSDYQPLLTPQNEQTIVKYVMELLWPFRYWTPQILKWHTVTLQHVITVSNNMSDHMDGLMQALAKKKTQ